MKTYTPVDLVQLGGPGLRTFFNLAKRWELNEEEQSRLLGHDLATLDEWRVRARAHEPVPLPREVLERLGAIFGIYASLMELLPGADRDASWLRAPNKAPIFDGRSALDRMSEPDIAGVLIVLQYLQVQRYG